MHLLNEYQALNSTNLKHLKQGFSPGFRLSAAYHIDSNYDLLVSFSHIGGWNSTRFIGPDNPLNWLVMRAPGGFFQTQDFTYQSMTWDYSTKLYNVELTLQKKFSNVISMLVGFRWLQLHKNLQGTIPPPDRIQPTWKSYPKADLAYVAWFENQPGTPAPATHLSGIQARQTISMVYRSGRSGNYSSVATFPSMDW
jgi:hypothetical protein